MSAGDVLGLWLAADPAREARTEWLRVLLAARAAGRRVELLDLRPPGAVDDPPLAAAEQRLLDELARDGVAPRAATAEALPAALREAGSVLALGSRARAGRPPALVLEPAWLARTRPDECLAALRDAGQVRAR